jgi:signal transduction histidine kinase
LKEIALQLQEELIYIDYADIKNEIEYKVEVENGFNLETDPVRLKIILSNFISNSIKYRTENVTCKIEVRGSKVGNYNVVSVEDNGIGIEDQYIYKIFDMFYRATTRSKGSGLGLYIVKESAEKLNAIVSVKSALNKGSIFTLTFPVSS